MDRGFVLTGRKASDLQKLLQNYKMSDSVIFEKQQAILIYHRE
jgi:hypothetical protein